MAFPAFMDAFIASSSSGARLGLGMSCKNITYVVSSGFSVQTTPNTTNGIDIIPTIPKIMLSCVSDTSGLFITHGKGSVTTIQITPSKINNFAFFFFVSIEFEYFMQY